MIQNQPQIQNRGIVRRATLLPCPCKRGVIELGKKKCRLCLSGDHRCAPVNIVRPNVTNAACPKVANDVLRPQMKKWYVEGNLPEGATFTKKGDQVAIAYGGQSFTYHGILTPFERQRQQTEARFSKYKK